MTQSGNFVTLFNQLSEFFWSQEVGPHTFEAKWHLVFKHPHHKIARPTTDSLVQNWFLTLIQNNTEVIM